MRILHVTDVYAPGLGGIETHVGELARRQAERGDDVTVLTHADAFCDGRGHDDTWPVRVVRRPHARAALRTDWSRFDVVHAHLSVVFPFTSPLAAQASRAGVPTVATVHSLWSRMAGIPALAITAYGLQGAPVTWTAVSHLAAEQVRAAVRGGPDVLVVPNAVDMAPRAASPPARPDGAVHLVSTMRIARRKRPRQLVAIFDDLRRAATRPVHLTVVGDGPLRPRVLRDVRRRGLEGMVTVTGRLQPPEVRRRLVEADVYVGPAKMESFGLAALEARCVGLPVVGRADSGMREFLEHGREGATATSDAGMVSELLRFVEDPDFLLRVSEHNRLSPSELTWSAGLRANDAAYARAGAALGLPMTPGGTAR